ncbi:conserved protein, unknown function, partial [Hepatocystis sp. ex Piliocolobus tephrosceles]
MNSKGLEILNLLEEKSFKQCEKLIASGLKGKKNDKLYLLLRCLLHSYVNEINECKKVLKKIDLDDYDETFFPVLKTIYYNLNEGSKLINLYEQKLKNMELNKSKAKQNGSTSSNNSVNKFIYNYKKETELILSNLFDYCINVLFFKKSSNISLKLYKSTQDSKYILYNCFLLYLNNSNNNTQIYNLCLTFLNSYKPLDNGQFEERFAYFLIVFFLNIKLKKFDNCIKINEYAKVNNLFLNTAQYDVYKLYTYFMFKKLEQCIPIIIRLIEQIPNNCDYYIFYMDIIIYLISKNHIQIQNIKDVFKYYKNKLMYLEFYQKCFFHYCISQLNSFPKNINTFWDIVTKNGEPGLNDKLCGDMLSFLLLMSRIGSTTSDSGSSSSQDGSNKNELEDLIKIVESEIDKYNLSVEKIYNEKNVKIYMYLFFLFLLKESKNNNMFYCIKNHLSTFNENMIAILIVFIKIVLIKLYKKFNNILSCFKKQNVKNDCKKDCENDCKKDCENDCKNDCKNEYNNEYNMLTNIKYMEICCKEIINFEKLLYLLYKKNVHTAFNRIMYIFIQRTVIYKSLKLEDDNLILLLVEMALYLDKLEVYTCSSDGDSNNMDIHDYYTTSINYTISKIYYKLNTGESKSIDEFLGKINIPYDEDCLPNNTNSYVTDSKVNKYIHKIIDLFFIKDMIHSNCTDNINKSNSNTKTNELNVYKKKIKLSNRKYYMLALSLLKYSYEYKKEIIEKENEKKKTKYNLNHEYINVLVLKIFLNNVLGNFSNNNDIIQKLNIKNIQLITYSPILFSYSHNYSYYNYLDNYFYIIFNYYNIQQRNLSTAIFKCFQNYSFFKINEIANSYLLNASNIYICYVKLLYLYKKQLQANKGEFYYDLFSRIKRNSVINNDYKTKFISFSKNSSHLKMKTIGSTTKIVTDTFSTTKTDNPTELLHKKINGKVVSEKCNTHTINHKNYFIEFVKKTNEDVFSTNETNANCPNETNTNCPNETNTNCPNETNTNWPSDKETIKSFFSKLLLDKYHMLLIDNQTILMKYNIPSFHFSMYKLYNNFFYNNISNISVKPVEAVEAVKPVEAVEAVKPVEAVEAVKPVEAVEAVKPVEAVEAVKPVEAAEA